MMKVTDAEGEIEGNFHTTYRFASKARFVDNHIPLAAYLKL